MVTSHWYSTRFYNIGYYALLTDKAENSSFLQICFAVTFAPMTLAARDKNVIWHPFTPQKNMPTPIAITHGKGTLLFDEQNNSYIDAISSWWVTLHGHAHPYIAERLYRQALQLEQVIFAGFTHEPAVALAERLLQILPDNFSKIFYSDNGSTSTEVAIKWQYNTGGTSNRLMNKLPHVKLKSLHLIMLITAIRLAQ